MAAAGQFDRVIDVSAANVHNTIRSEDLSARVYQIYAQFGEMCVLRHRTGIPLTVPNRSAIFPWESKQGKAHFYVEYGDTASVKRARSAAISEFACFVVSKDKQHRKRFALLSSRTLANGATGLALKPTKGATRYSPYTIPGSSQASHYVAGDYNGSSHTPGHLGGIPSNDFLANQGISSSMSHSLSPLYNGYNNAETSPSPEEGMFLTEHLGSCIAAVDGDQVSASFPQTSPNPSSKVSMLQKCLCLAWYRLSNVTTANT
jgi:hypothetical protein